MKISAEQATMHLVRLRSKMNGIWKQDNSRLKADMLEDITSVAGSYLDSKCCKFYE